jgi:cellulose synthase/poly-beta-1,6-N-acetylglucosamine synthase-like glycosyltransferase
MSQLLSLLMYLLYLLLILAAVPMTVLLLQALLAFARLGPAPAASGRRPRLAVLVPAHNEAGGISATLDSLRPQLVAGDRILVVADNCSDDTATVAARGGAEVRERFSDTERGKGYALDFGVRCLADDPPEVVVIVDADCIVGAGALDRLARDAVQHGVPIQALYLMRAPGASGLKKIAEFAWVVKNLVRPLGFARLGLPCQLMGTGMAFDWPTLSTAALANGHIVEDMKLGLDLARAGKAPRFCPAAEVYSTFPSNDAGTAAQRTRWEHGHLSMIVSAVPSMLLQGLFKGRPQLLALALDLSVPPLALLAMVVIALFGLGLLATVLSGVLLPLAWATLLGLAFGAAVLLAWWAHGRQVLAGRELLLALWYVVRKVPLYCRFVVQRQVEWVRSKRDSE